MGDRIRPRSGLCWESVHPRLLRQLSNSFLVRLCAIFMMFEEAPTVTTKWTNLIALLAKAAGGQRPIALIFFVFRLARHARSLISARWEQENCDPVWWGSGTRTAERADWLHNVVARFAASNHMEFDSVLTDLFKYYEYLSHDELAREAAECGFNRKLLRSLCTVYASGRALHWGGATSEVLRAASRGSARP